MALTVSGYVQAVKQNIGDDGQPRRGYKVNLLDMGQDITVSVDDSAGLSQGQYVAGNAKVSSWALNGRNGFSIRCPNGLKAANPPNQGR